MYWCSLGVFVSNRVTDKRIIFELCVEAKDGQSKSCYSLQSNLSFRVKSYWELNRQHDPDLQMKDLEF